MTNVFRNHARGWTLVSNISRVTMPGDFLLLQSFDGGWLPYQTALFTHDLIAFYGGVEFPEKLAITVKTVFAREIRLGESIFDRIEDVLVGMKILQR